MWIIAIKSVVLVENGPIWSKMNTLKQNYMKSSRSEVFDKNGYFGIEFENEQKDKN